MKNKKNLKVAACVLMLLGLLLGCSKDKDEKGAVEQLSDKVAGKAVEQMQKPLNKARESQALQDAQSKKMEDLIEDSGQPQ